jgi:glutaredoxin
MSNLIVIFTLNGCSHCVELKRRMLDEGIKFSEIEVGMNQEVWNQVVQQTGHNSLPTVYISIDGGDQGPVFVPERDYQSHDELIEKIKKYV